MSRDAPGLLVERAAVLDADRLGHGDLHVVDVAAVPERLEDAVAEPEDQQVPDGLLAQVVVDAVDLRLAEDLADLAVQPDRRLEVVAERLLDDDPPPAAVVVLVVEPDPPELGDDLGERRRLGREVEEAVAAACPCSLSIASSVVDELVEAAGVVEVAAAGSGSAAANERPGGLVERQDPASTSRARRGSPRGTTRRRVRPAADRDDARTRAAAGSSATAGRAPG